MAEPAVIRVIIKNKVKMLVKEEKRGSMSEIRRIEVDMRAIFYHSKCTPMHIAEYLILEQKWKTLIKHKH
jgi:hypothetical protein